MPNTWDYAVVLHEPVEDREDVVRRVLTTGSGIGYELRVEAGVFDDEGEEHAFTTRDGLLTFLATRGGLATLWCDRKDSDIGLSFDWEGPTISVGVLHDLLPDDGPGEEGQGGSAADLQTIFSHLCRELRPAYGYSSDEWMLEAALGTRDFPARWHAFEQTVRELHRPPLLFWLNYFAKDYFDRIGRECLSTLPHRIVPVGTDGVFVYLSDHPWDARIALLDDEGKHYVAAFESVTLVDPAKRNGFTQIP